MIAAEMMRKLGVPACVVEGMLLEGNVPRNKKSIHEEWVGTEEASRIMDVSPEKVIKMATNCEIIEKIHLGRVYFSRKSVEMFRKKKLDYIIDGGKLYTPSKKHPQSKSGRRKIYLNLTRYAKYQVGYKMCDIAAAFGKDISFIQSIIKDNNLEVDIIRGECYIKYSVFWKFLEEKNKAKGNQ